MTMVERVEHYAAASWSKFAKTELGQKVDPRIQEWANAPAFNDQRIRMAESGREYQKPVSVDDYGVVSVTAVVRQVDYHIRRHLQDSDRAADEIGVPGDVSEAYNHGYLDGAQEAVKIFTAHLAERSPVDRYSALQASYGKEPARSPDRTPERSREVKTPERGR